MNICFNIERIKALIAQTEKESHRKAGEVLLLAVSKQQPYDAILEAHQHGINDFAENYFQEALPKIEQLKNVPLCWHFIGPIQSNKTKGIAQYFDWVHSIDRSKIAIALNEHRPANNSPLQICLQINLVGEKTKAGISIAEAEQLAKIVSQLPNLQLRGLMTIPPAQSTQTELYNLFTQLNELKAALNKSLSVPMDTLSMGMSDDIVPAIQAGSTIVRLGRAIFGERQVKRHEN